MSPPDDPTLEGVTSAPTVPRAVGRALDVLEVVLSHDRCNLTAVANEVGLTPTTALRHLRALEARGYVDRDDAGQFSAGPTMVRLATSLRDEGQLEWLIALTKPRLEALVESTGESSYLAVSDGRVATYVATVESPRAIRHVGWVGQNLPLAGTAVGAALTEVGSIATRTGAVEPDITAVSLAIATTWDFGVAISVVGPDHRLDRPSISNIENHLLIEVGGLIADLGLEQEHRHDLPA